MNFVSRLKVLIGKKEDNRKETYLTLLIDTDHIAGACWNLGASGVPDLTHAVARRIDRDAWKERTLAGDEVVSALEERAGTQNISRVIYGLPYEYLTAEGDIRPEIKNHLKQFSRDLELTPIGFVPIHQAIVYKLRRDEGVPPSLILLGITDNAISVSVYEVGKLTGQKVLRPHSDLALELVTQFRDLLGITALPSRMLLFGIDSSRLLKLKDELTRFAWTQHATFLHFPKFQIVTPDTAVASVSMAGASELMASLKTAGDAVPESGPDSAEEELADEESVEDERTAVAVSGNEAVAPKDGADEPDQDDERDKVAEDTVISGHQPAGTAADAGAATKTPDHEYAFEEASNVTFVAPEAIGFHKNKDVIEVESGISGKPDRPAGKDEPKNLRGDKGDAVHGFENSEEYAVPDAPGATRNRKLRLPLNGAGLKIAGSLTLITFIILFVLWYLAYQYPSAEVVVTLLRSPVEQSETVTIDPGIAAVDRETGSIPGIVKEATVSGEKTVETTGKKKVGDPAKGTVTIYNKTVSAKSFPKGSRLVSGSLSFTLDTDIQVASASESIGSITFGKSTAPITATDIGTQGNLPAATEFSFKDVSSSIAIARNDEALSGGTSRDVIVVSRADYDAIIEAVTAELTDSANSQLAGSIGGSSRLIEGTIENDVVAQTFSAELNEEVPEVGGQITLKVSGLTYDVNDITALFSDEIQGAIPPGYTLEESSLEFVFTDPEVQKNGSVTATVGLHGFAVPAFEEAGIKELIGGKSKTDAETAITSMAGVRTAVVTVRNPLFSNSVPRQSDKVSVTVNIE